MGCDGLKNQSIEIKIRKASARAAPPGVVKESVTSDLPGLLCF